MGLIMFQIQCSQSDLLIVRTRHFVPENGMDR